MRGYLSNRFAIIFLAPLVSEDFFTRIIWVDCENNPACVCLRTKIQLILLFFLHIYNFVVLGSWQKEIFVSWCLAHLDSSSLSAGQRHERGNARLLPGQFHMAGSNKWSNSFITYDSHDPIGVIRSDDDGRLVDFFNCA